LGENLPCIGGSSGLLTFTMMNHFHDFWKRNCMISALKYSIWCSDLHTLCSIDMKVNSTFNIHIMYSDVMVLYSFLFCYCRSNREHSTILCYFTRHSCQYVSQPWLFRTCKWPSWCLNFSVWLEENILFEHKKLKLWNKRHFVENKTDCAACLKNAANFFVV
jgi:hypothetical protein